MVHRWRIDSISINKHHQVDDGGDDDDDGGGKDGERRMENGEEERDDDGMRRRVSRAMRSLRLVLLRSQHPNERCARRESGLIPARLVLPPSLSTSALRCVVCGAS